MRDEREVLTRQIVLKKLSDDATREIFGAFFMFLMVTAVLLPLQLLSRLVVTSVLMYVAYAFCTFKLICAIILKIKARSGAFTVTEDTLVEMNDNKFSLVRFIEFGSVRGLMYNALSLGNDKRHLIHEFKFESGKVFIAGAEEYKNTRLATAAEFSLPGDKFYIVTYNSAPNKIVRLFSAKSYCYKEN